MGELNPDSWKPGHVQEKEMTCFNVRQVKTKQGDRFFCKREGEQEIEEEEKTRGGKGCKTNQDVLRTCTKTHSESSH